MTIEGDNKLVEQIEGFTGNHITINGHIEPTMNVKRGVWQRWRILHAGWYELDAGIYLKSLEKYIDIAANEKYNQKLIPLLKTRKYWL